MADLFDVNAAGAGFHITSHMIAIIALFVACFAITGYITFRDDSIGDEKLKDASPGGVLTRTGDFYEYRNTLTLSTLANVAGDVAADLGLFLPAGAQLINGRLQTLVAGSVTANAVLVGTPGATAVGAAPAGAVAHSAAVAVQTLGNNATITLAPLIAGAGQNLYLTSSAVLTTAAPAGTIFVQFNFLSSTPVTYTA